MTEIKLYVNEKQIPLNPIMSSVLSNILTGFVDVLKDIPEDKNTIKVELSL